MNVWLVFFGNGQAGGYIIHIPDMIVVPEEVKQGITAQMDSLDEVIGWLEQINAGKREI